LKYLTSFIKKFGINEFDFPFFDIALYLYNFKTQ
jgi:hypothetical protein